MGNVHVGPPSVAALLTGSSGAANLTTSRRGLKSEAMDGRIGHRILESWPRFVVRDENCSRKAAKCAKNSLGMDGDPAGRAVFTSPNASFSLRLCVLARINAARSRIRAWRYSSGRGRHEPTGCCF